MLSLSTNEKLNLNTYTALLKNLSCFEICKVPKVSIYKPFFYNSHSTIFHLRGLLIRRVTQVALTGMPRVGDVCINRYARH